MISYYTYNRAIFLHFQTFVHMSYTIYVFVFGPLYTYGNVMEMYFEAMRFVSILLDFSKNEMYIGVF